MLAFQENKTTPITAWLKIILCSFLFSLQNRRKIVTVLTIERKNSGARVWHAVPGNVDAQTFGSLLSLIPTLSQISVWMYIILFIQRAQEQWIDTEYFCYHYSLSVKCRMQSLDILNKNCVSNCLCWFCYTYEPLISLRKLLPCWNKWLFL